MGKDKSKAHAQFGMLSIILGLDPASVVEAWRSLGAWGFSDMNFGDIKPLGTTRRGTAWSHGSNHGGGAPSRNLQNSAHGGRPVEHAPAKSCKKQRDSEGSNPL